MLRDLGDWLFRDRTRERIVIAQMPNAALWIVLVAFVAGQILQSGRAATAAGDVATAALVLWALDEIVRGVNPWRRILGAAVIGGMALWYLRRRVCC